MRSVTAADALLDLERLCAEAGKPFPAAQKMVRCLVEGVTYFEAISVVHRLLELDAPKSDFAIPLKAEHGRPVTYRNGCRCSECVDYMSNYSRAWRAGQYRRVPVESVARLVTGDIPELARQAGVSDRTLYRIRARRYWTVSMETVERICMARGIALEDLLQQGAS